MARSSKRGSKNTKCRNTDFDAMVLYFPETVELHVSRQNFVAKLINSGKSVAQSIRHFVSAFRRAALNSL